MRLGRLLAVGAGAVAARYVLREMRTSPAAPGLERTNFRGRTVTLAAGPALAVGAATAGALGAGSAPAGAAALLAGVGAGTVGLYDDVVGARPEQKTAKGFAGHLAALREGRVTAGLVKIVGVGAAGLAPPRCSPPTAGSPPTPAGSGPVPSAVGSTCCSAPAWWPAPPTWSTCSTCARAGR